MVRLKLEFAKLYKELNLKQSQFHYGSIKTFKGGQYVLFESSLNSTMVRLKRF